MRRLLTSVSLSYLLVAFLFILLTMINAEEEGNLVWLGTADAGLIVAFSVFGILFVVVLGIRILLDGKHREELERRLREPRRKSDVASNRR